MSFWTPTGFKKATAGRWLVRPLRHRVTMIKGVSIDSRSIETGETFVAIRGDRFDGHQFIAAAIERGASLVIVDDPSIFDHEAPKMDRAVPILHVTDTIKALGKLAQTYRRTLDGVRVVAVCGSNGKTTTVRLLETLLGSELSGTTSPKSFNNAIGVPLTILRTKPSDDFLVCEVGTNFPGEIATLGAMLQPHLALVTSVGRAHMEHFKSVDDVAKEDASMFAHVQRGGTVVMPTGSAALEHYASPVPNLVRFGAAPGARLRLKSVKHTTRSDGALGLAFELTDGRAFSVPLIGQHNAHNAMAAIAVAQWFGLSDDAITAALDAAAPAELRLQRREIGGVEVFVDCYNANPDSMAAAINTFAELTPSASRRVLFLGDMLELGEIGPEAHREIGQLITERCDAQVVVTIGSLALHIAEEISQAMPDCTLLMHSALDANQADRLAAQLQPGDAVLLKGSRGIHLERLLVALERRFAAQLEVSAA